MQLAEILFLLPISSQCSVCMKIINPWSVKFMFSIGRRSLIYKIIFINRLNGFRVEFEWERFHNDTQWMTVDDWISLVFIYMYPTLLLTVQSIFCNWLRIDNRLYLEILPPVSPFLKQYNLHSLMQSYGTMVL